MEPFMQRAFWSDYHQKLSTELMRKKIQTHQTLSNYNIYYINISIATMNSLENMYYQCKDTPIIAIIETNNLNINDAFHCFINRTSLTNMAAGICISGSHIIRIHELMINYSHMRHIWKWYKLAEIIFMITFTVGD